MFDKIKNNNINNNSENSEDVEILKRKILILNNELKYFQKELFYKTRELNLIKQDLDRNDYLNNFFKVRNINIAYVLVGFPTLSQTFVLNELRWLIKNGFNVKVFSYDNPEKRVKLDFDLEIIRFDTSEDLMTNLETLVLKHDIDLLHTHFIWPACTRFTYPVAKKLKVPFTFFVHAYDIFINDVDDKNNLTEIANSEFCKGIFTLGNYHKNYLLERDVPKNKIIITKQATDYQIIPFKKRNNKIKKIISISRFVEKKGIDTLIQAAKLLEKEDLEFHIYGFGNLENHYKNLIADLEINNLFLEGSLNGFDEVKNAFENADLFVAPCKKAKNGDMDGMPTVIFESMACGIPVVTTEISVIPEVIVDNKNGFITKSNNPELLALKIKEVMCLDENRLNRICKNAQNDVQRISSVDKTMDIVLDVWARIF